MHRQTIAVFDGLVVHNHSRSLGWISFRTPYTVQLTAGAHTNLSHHETTVSDDDCKQRTVQQGR